MENASIHTKDGVTAFSIAFIIFGPLLRQMPQPLIYSDSCSSSFPPVRNPTDDFMYSTLQEGGLQLRKNFHRKGGRLELKKQH